MTAHTISRLLLAALYLTAGVFHLVAPGPFVSVTPGWVPGPGVVVMLTGWAEIAGALGLVQPWFGRVRVAAAWGLALYALCVWPANFQHMWIDMEKPDQGLGLVYHLPRLALQPVLIWWPLWAARVVRWPFRRG